MDTNEVTKLQREMKKQGLNAVQNLPNAYDHDFVRQNAALFEGNFIEPFYAPWEAEPQSPATKAFLSGIKAITNDPVELTEFGWIDAMEFVDGLKGAGPEFTQQKMIDYLNAHARVHRPGLGSADRLDHRPHQPAEPSRGEDQGTVHAGTADQGRQVRALRDTAGQTLHLPRHSQGGRPNPGLQIVRTRRCRVIEGGGPMRANEEIQSALCAPGQFFEIETVEIGAYPRAPGRTHRATSARCLSKARRRGARDFLVLDDEHISHERHLQLAQRFASSLVELGVRKGDRVAIAMRNLTEWSIAFFGAVMIGAIAVPVNAFGTGEELGFAITDGRRCGRRRRRGPTRTPRRGSVRLGWSRRGRHPTRGSGTRAVSSRQGRHVRRAARARARGAGGRRGARRLRHDLLHVGTSARPKGVLGTHRNICSNLLSMMYSGARSSLRDGPSGSNAGPAVQLLSVPLFHATGFVIRCCSGTSFFGER